MKLFIGLIKIAKQTGLSEFLFTRNLIYNRRDLRVNKGDTEALGIEIINKTEKKHFCQNCLQTGI